MFTLSDWIEDLGDAAAAELFGVTLRRVQSWRRGERLPRPGKAKDLIELSNGRLDYSGIYEASPMRAA